MINKNRPSFTNVNRIAVKSGGVFKKQALFSQWIKT